jgi:hypothetical protein
MAILDKKIARTRWLTQRLKLSPLRIKLWEEEKNSELQHNTPLKSGHKGDIIPHFEESLSIQKEDDMSEQEEVTHTIEKGKEEEEPELHPVLQDSVSLNEEEPDIEIGREEMKVFELDDLSEIELDSSLQQEHVQSDREDYNVELPFSTIIELALGQPILLQ